MTNISSLLFSSCFTPTFSLMMGLEMPIYTWQPCTKHSDVSYCAKSHRNVLVDILIQEIFHVLVMKSSGNLPRPLGSMQGILFQELLPTQISNKLLEAGRFYCNSSNKTQ